MKQEDIEHFLQIAFQDKDGAAICNAKYSLIRNGVEVGGVTDNQGFTELLRGNKPDLVEVWLTHNAKQPFLVGKTTMRHGMQKSSVAASCQNEPQFTKVKTEDHSKKSKHTVEHKKYSVQFSVKPDRRRVRGRMTNIPPFNCTGSIRYRLVQDGIVLAEGKTKGEIDRVETDSESEVLIYIAGDKRYKPGEAYKEEMNAGSPPMPIPAWKKAKPNADLTYKEQLPNFEFADWVDVSKIYDKNHPDVTPESKGIYAGSWTPPPERLEKHRRYEVTVDGRKVVLFWIEDACNDGLHNSGRNTFTNIDPDTHWYMTVEQVINRTHPKVFKVLFEVIKELKLTYVEISCSWRPGIGSSAHREGRALDISSVEAISREGTATEHVNVKDTLPGSREIDKTDTPTSEEPELMKKVRLALFRQHEVLEIFSPWSGMFNRHSKPEDSFKSSYVLQNVTRPNPGESNDAFQKRKAAADKADRESGVASHESGTFAAHRNHLHFDIKLG